MNKFIKVFAGMAFALSIGTLSAKADDANVEAEKAAVVKVADDFDKALHASDADAVKRLLDENVQILEGGHAQKSRAEYMGGHMLSDMKFLKFVTSEIKERQVSVSGDLAWVITHSQTTGEYKGRKINNPSRGMLVMKKGEDKNWRITMVHWGDK